MLSGHGIEEEIDLSIATNRACGRWHRSCERPPVKELLPRANVAFEHRCSQNELCPIDCPDTGKYKGSHSSQESRDCIIPSRKHPKFGSREAAFHAPSIPHRRTVQYQASLSQSESHGYCSDSASYFYHLPNMQYRSTANSSTEYKELSDLDSLLEDPEELLQSTDQECPTSDRSSSYLKSYNKEYSEIVTRKMLHFQNVMEELNLVADQIFT